MTDINDLVQEFPSWTTSNEGVYGESLFEMRRLYKILEEYLEVSLLVTFLRLPFDLADYYSSQSYLDETESRAKFKILLDGFRKMFDQSIFKSKDLGRMLMLLPGVVVQKELSTQGMAVLYGIKSDLLECLIKSTLRLGSNYTLTYIMDDYLSGFLQDKDRSQLYYCDPMLQHISICRHMLSLQDGTNALGS